MRRKNILESDLNQNVDDLYGLYSDMYKERYNIRPRWIKPSELSVEELQSMIDDLRDTPWEDDDDREQYQFHDDDEVNPRFYTDLDNAELEDASMRIAAREPYHPLEDLPSKAGMGFGRHGRNKIHEKAPKGGEKVVKALKKNKDVDNPWAVAWSMKNKGYIEEQNKGKNQVAKITINQLRRIIKEELENAMGSSDDDHSGKPGLKKIDMSTLQKLCPKAAGSLHMSNLGGEVDHYDMFWVITEKPEMISSDDYGEEWTQTNEPELAETLSDGWDSISCDVKGKRVVLLCGSYDDETGYYWDNADQEWVSYNY